jgi:hypothetical protein
MARKVLRHLWDALDLRLSEVLQSDIVVGIAGGVTSLLLALKAPSALLRGVPIAAGLVGVVIGAVLAGVAVQTAFLDQAFLRKVRAIGRDPVRHVAPFLFTATIGVFSMLGILVLAVLEPSSNVWILATFGSVTGFLTVWTMTSLLSCLAGLVQFLHLRVDAIDVPDDI